VARLRLESKSLTEVLQLCAVQFNFAVICSNCLVDRLYSASLNGQIIVWNTSSRKKLQTLQVPLEDEGKEEEKDILRNICCHNNKLMCGMFVMLLMCIVYYGIYRSYYINKSYGELYCVLQIFTMICTV